MFHDVCIFMQPEVNYLAVLVCGIASMVLGFIYYGPLFGKLYAKLMGWEHIDAAKREEMKKTMMRSYILSFVGSLVMAYILSHVITYATAYSGSKGVSAGLSSGFWMWLGFIAPVTMGNVLWGNQPWKLWVLGNGYNLLQLLIFGMILSSWK
jgi:hypothetical protein